MSDAERRQPWEACQMALGKVKWFNDAKGFGFIQQGEGGPDIFVHYTQVKMDGFKTLPEGCEVEFEVKQGEKGLSATNVMRVG
jgi:CspA family cold shock protein